MAFKKYLMFFFTCQQKGSVIFLSTYSSRGFSENEKVGWQEKFLAQIIATSAEVKGVLSKGDPHPPPKNALIQL